MSTTGKARATAHDAEAEASAPAHAELGFRPATQAETDYLEARVEDTGAAVKKIRDQIRALERSLKEAERLHEDAKAAKKAGYDLPDVQKRRAA